MSDQPVENEEIITENENMNTQPQNTQPQNTQPQNTHPQNAQPQNTNNAGSAVKNVLLFPFRLIGFVVKWSARIVLAVFLLILAAGLIRSALPMDLPEAQGMTYFELMAERREAVKPEGAIISERMVLMKAAYPFFL